MSDPHTAASPAQASRTGVWFDLTVGLPVAVSALRSELGTRACVRVLGNFLRRGLRDPFATLGASSSDRETFTRGQLRSVLLLDDVLRIDLGLPVERTHKILGQIVAETGSRFIASNLLLPNRIEWERLALPAQRSFAQSILSRFGNAEAELAETPGSAFGFDVHVCHFVTLCHRLGRSELAPLFCRADSVFFGRKDSPVRLQRETTLAAGGDVCSFRFHWSEDESKPPLGD